MKNGYSRATYRQDLAKGLGNLGLLLQNLGRIPEAEAAHRQALGHREKLVADFSATPDYRRDLATSHNSLGVLLYKSGKPLEAEAAYRQALTLKEGLVAEFPLVPKFRQALAAGYHNLGMLLSDLGKLPEAETATRQELAIQEKLAADSPGLPEYREGLAGSHNSMGILLHKLGRRTEATTAFRNSLTLQEKLANDFSGIPQYRISLASRQTNLAHMLRNSGQEIDALELYGRAIGSLKSLVEAESRLVDARQFLRIAHVGRAETLDRLERFADAIQDWDRAIALSPPVKQRGPAADTPAVAEYPQSLARSHTGLGFLFNKSGQRTEAEAAFRKALAIQEKLAADCPGVPQYLIELAGCQVNWGHLLRDGGQEGKALEWYDRAIASLKSQVEAQPDLANGQQYLQYAHWGRADALVRLERFADAIRNWDRAIELSPPGQQLQLRMGRATSQIRAGLASEAIAGIAELTNNRALSADQWYDFACVYAVASNKIADKKQEYADRAMELLQKATETGYKNAAHMKKDSDLDALRDREDFKKLIAKLEPKTKQ